MIKFLINNGFSLIYDLFYPFYQFLYPAYIDFSLCTTCLSLDKPIESAIIGYMSLGFVVCTAILAAVTTKTCHFGS